MTTGQKAVVSLFAHGHSVQTVALDNDEPHWTRTLVVEVDGRPMPIRISNVPPPGTPRRIYWFSASPGTADEAEAIGVHIEGLHGILDRA